MQLHSTVVVFLIVKLIVKIVSSSVRFITRIGLRASGSLLGLLITPMLPSLPPSLCCDIILIFSTINVLMRHLCVFVKLLLPSIREGRFAIN